MIDLRYEPCLFSPERVHHFHHLEFLPDRELACMFCFQTLSTITVQIDKRARRL